MAITATDRNTVISLLVGMFDAAPTAAIMESVMTSYVPGNEAAFANDMAATTEFQSLYPVWLTDAEFATNFTTNILDGNTSATELADAITAVESLLTAGNTRGETANIAVDYLLNTAGTADPIYGTAVQALMNKVEVATYFATTQLDASADFASLQAVVADVTSDATTVTNQKTLIDANLDSLSQTLTTGQDNLTGSAGNDGFTAWIFDNQNTAQSGDMINGGAGTDTLLAEIGESQDFAISLKTESLEVAQFRIQENDNSDGGANDIGGDVQIDAQDMNGTVEFWGVDQRAKLIVEDIQAGSNDVTIGWRDSDAGANVDLEIYFDNITAPSAVTADSQLFIELLDLEAMAATGDPLTNNPYIGLTFTMDGVTQTLEGTSAIKTSYAALVDELNAALDTDPAWANITASLGSTFTAINSDDGNSYEGTTIVLTNSGAEELGAGGWIADGVLPPDTNIHTTQSTTPPATSTELTQTNIIFDEVGSGSKGGDFVAGEISQGGYSGSAGIQQFNIQVQDNSWANSIASTNDTLEVVMVENESGFDGTLRIDSLDDARVFDASGMDGAVNLTAELEENVISKYLDLTDTNTDPDADDVNFNYTMGTGNDTLSLEVDGDAVGHEDFILNVSAGTGDDTVTVGITDSAGNLEATTNEWYANQAVGVNVNELNVLGGSGNDTLTVQGGGDYMIEGGSGNDDIYVDNTATKATWTVGTALAEAATYTGANVAGQRSADIVSDAIVSGVLYETKLTIAFNGFEATVDVDTDSGDNYVGSQLTLNNAIKSAIDSDTVLSKWLAYEDGPGNVLLIKSLVDDVLAETAAPTFTLVGSGSAAGGDYNAADVAALSSTAKNAIISGDATLNSGSADAAIATAMNTAIDLFEGGAGDHLTDVEVTAAVGAASTFDNDSIVHADAGSNTIVLSSDDTSNNTVVFDTTFTKTSIISFEADYAVADGHEDILDFTAYLTNETSTTASAISATRIATTLNADATVEVNSVTVSTAAAFTTTDTFAGLTAANLLSAINNGGTNYAGLADATLNAQINAGGIANFYSSAGEAVVLIENDGNVGEFKAFQLTWDDDSATNANADFSAATLLGTIDFGSEAITAAGNFTVAGLA